MGRNAKFPKLTELAHRLASIEFPPAETIRVGKARNLFLMPDGVTYAVRLFLRGKLVSLGYTVNEESAARFADMVFLQFYPWKLRRPVRPDPLNFNYTPAQAKKDCVGVPAAADLLTLLEVSLVLHGLIPSRDTLLQGPGGPRLDRIKELEDRVTELEHKVVTLAPRRVDLVSVPGLVPYSPSPYRYDYEGPLRTTTITPTLGDAPSSSPPGLGDLFGG